MFFGNRGREVGCMPSVDGDVSEDIRAGEGSSDWCTWAQMFGWVWVAAMVATGVLRCSGDS